MATNSHARLILRDLLGGGLRQIFATLGGLVTFPIVARMLDQEAFGAWQLLGATSFFIGFADLGLSTAVERASVRDEPERARRTLALALAVMSAIIPIAAMLSYAFVLDVARGAARLRPDIERAGLVTIAAGALFAWAQPYRFFLVTKGYLRSIAHARSIGSATQMLLTIGLIKLTPSVLAPAFGLLAGYLIEAALTLRAARSIDPALPLRPRLLCDRAETLAALRDGAAGFTVNLAAATALRVDLIVISRVADLATVAAYAAGGRAVEMAFLLTKQSVVALTPRLGRKDERATTTWIGTLIFAGVIAAGMATLAVVGQKLIVLWAGPVAEGRVPAIALALLGLGAFVAATFEVASSTVLLGGRSGWDSAIPFTVGSGINLALSISLSPFFGLWAVAGSTLVGNLVTAALTWRAAVSMFGWSLRDLATLLAGAMAPGLAALVVALPLREIALRDGLASLGASFGAGLAGLGVIVGLFRWFRTPAAMAAEGRILERGSAI